MKVSLDRPFIQDHGSGQVLEWEAAALHWLERQGYDLSYISDVDLHEKPAQLLDHRAYLSLGLFGAIVLVLIARVSPLLAIMASGAGMVTCWYFFQELLGIQLPMGPF